MIDGVVEDMSSGRFGAIAEKLDRSVPSITEGAPHPSDAGDQMSAVPRVTWEQLLVTFGTGKYWSRATEAKYRSTVRTYFEPLLPHDIRLVSYFSIFAWRREVARAQLAASVVRHAENLMLRLLQHAVLIGVIRKNPFDAVHAEDVGMCVSIAEKARASIQSAAAELEFLSPGVFLLALDALSIAPFDPGLLAAIERFEAVVVRCRNKQQERRLKTLEEAGTQAVEGEGDHDV